MQGITSIPYLKTLHEHLFCCSQSAEFFGLTHIWKTFSYWNCSPAAWVDQSSPLDTLMVPWSGRSPILQLNFGVVSKPKFKHFNPFSILSFRTELICYGMIATKALGRSGYCSVMSDEWWQVLAALIEVLADYNSGIIWFSYSRTDGFWWMPAILIWFSRMICCPDKEVGWK